MHERDRTALKKRLPDLRRDFEVSRRMVAQAFERAETLVTSTEATRRLLAASAAEDCQGARSIDAHVWSAAAREVLRAARERDRELGVVAHELRQSLSAALAADQLSATSTDERTVTHARDVLTRQLLHLSELIETLLDYSRLSVDRRADRPRLVDMNDIVAAAAETVEAIAAERRQRVRVEAASGCATVVGHPTRLRQAVLNLLQNAVRYTPNEGQILATVRRQDRQLTVDVRDTGEGIDKAMLQRIFEPFVRGSGLGSGLGIGLALVRRIAEMHGGTVRAASDGPGLGSTFTLFLPAAEAHQAEPA